MKKGIATQTILLLLLGILVVAIIAYLVYKYAFNPVLPKEVCRSRAVSWCTLCKNAYGSGFNCPSDGTPPDPDCYVPVGDDLIECAAEYFSPVPANCGTECCHQANVWCAAFIGIG